MQSYLKDIDSENMHDENIKNEEIMNLEFEEFITYL
jgi:hypothetical protein